jgi:hypothetical protein
MSVPDLAKECVGNSWWRCCGMGGRRGGDSSRFCAGCAVAANIPDEAKMVYKNIIWRLNGG